MSEVFWIEGTPPVRLAIVLCPLGDRTLTAELLDLKQRGIETIISLLDEREAEWLGLADEGAAAEKVGLGFLNFPITDTQVPRDTDAFRKFIEGVANRVGAGEAVGVHCRGSIGRSTVATACTLIHQGWKPGVALAAIEEARGCPVPNTEGQRRWILAYRAQA
jgi:protein-tyrosine phosphatase